MSKSSSTNYPNGFLSKDYLISRYMSSFIGGVRFINTRSEIWLLPYRREEGSLGGYSGEGPPLPLPHREDKLTNADGTAVFPWESR